MNSNIVVCVGVRGSPPTCNAAFNISLIRSKRSLHWRTTKLAGKIADMVLCRTAIQLRSIVAGEIECDAEKGSWR
jgi:hypothetical protein